MNKILDSLNKNFPVIIDEQATMNNYYKGIQFAIIEIDRKEIEIADGGFVDWTQQLLENKKERMLISGLGIEYLARIFCSSKS